MKKGGSERKDKLIQVWVSGRDEEAWDGAAVSRGMSLSEFVRRCVNGVVGVSAPAVAAKPVKEAAAVLGQEVRVASTSSPAGKKTAKATVVCPHEKGEGYSCYLGRCAGIVTKANLTKWYEKLVGEDIHADPERDSVAEPEVAAPEEAF
jgi:hypothetical protein